MFKFAAPVFGALDTFRGVEDVEIQANREMVRLVSHEPAAADGDGGGGANFVRAEAAMAAPDFTEFALDESRVVAGGSIRSVVGLKDLTQAVRLGDRLNLPLALHVDGGAEPVVLRIAEGGEPPAWTLEHVFGAVVGDYGDADIGGDGSQPAPATQGRLRDRLYPSQSQPATLPSLSIPARAREDADDDEELPPTP